MPQAPGLSEFAAGGRCDWLATYRQLGLLIGERDMGDEWITRSGVAFVRGFSKLGCSNSECLPSSHRGRRPTVLGKDFLRCLRSSLTSCLQELPLLQRTGKARGASSLFMVWDGSALIGRRPSKLSSIPASGVLEEASRGGSLGRRDSSKKRKSKLQIIK